MKTGIANLPLHYGKAPRWLFDRMKGLAREITLVIATEFGTRELLIKLSDPFWFQAFGCVLGFDWHSSGLTTTVCGALKEGIKGLEKELGLFVAGGKGATSRKTPLEIENFGSFLSINPENLIYASKMAAKVDSAALQDGYHLYHHCFIFTKDGLWSVVQQGMNEETRYARRYHWLSEKVTDFVCEPHSAICCEQRGKVLNMVAQESEEARKSATFIAKEKPEHIFSEIKKLKNLNLPSRHLVLIEDIEKTRLDKILLKTYETQPQNFEHLLGLKGIGPKTIRALSLLSELIYGARPSFRDPVRYSFAHGGKDGHPYPVDRENYDQSINFLKEALNSAKIGHTEKLKAFRRLANLIR
ncbi:MAG: DUF763 domain-containing protein [Candidatus Aminicenantia bacterium]